MLNCFVSFKISRVLSAKVALAIRYDALAEDSEGTDMAIEARAKVERMLVALDEDKVRILFFYIVFFLNLNF